jgi:hypothetical protein
MVRGMVLTIFVELVKKVIVTRLLGLGSARILLSLFLRAGMRQSRCLLRGVGWARSKLTDCMAVLFPNCSEVRSALIHLYDLTFLNGQ